MADRAAIPAAATPPILAGKVTVKGSNVSGDCAMPGCTYHCFYVSETVKLSVDKTRKALQAHMNHEHRLRVHQYYCALVIDGTV